MTSARDPGLGFPSGGGECGGLVRAFAWEDTPLGPISSWSASLKTIVNLVLDSHVPMVLAWGPELIQIYNDACRETLPTGAHPAAMGRRAPTCWPELWRTFGRKVESVMGGGEAIRSENDAFLRRRNGGHHESYWTYSCSPVRDVESGAHGVLLVYIETTKLVISERRARMLRMFADRLATVTTTAEVGTAAMAHFPLGRLDVPFAVAYDLDAAGTVRVTRVAPDEVLPPKELEAAVRDHIATGAGTSPPITLPPVFVPNAPWPEPVTRAVVVTVPPSSKMLRPSHFIAVGLSPRQSYDEEYRRHIEQLIDCIAQARAHIEAVEARTRAEAERRDLLLQSPVATVLLTGPDHYYELANRAFVDIVEREVVGKAHAEVFPELVNTKLTEILDRAYRTGEEYAADEQFLPLVRNGVLGPRWFKFNVQPLRDQSGDITGLMSVIVDITEAVSARLALEKLDTEREELLKALEAANRSKDEFLAMLGHELRNPLAPIMTALHLMKLKEPEAHVRERAIIERQSGHLIHLVDDLLDVSRVARGKVNLNRSQFELGDVIGCAVETVSPLFEQKRQILTIDVPSDGIRVEADPIRLRQVFANLLTNAAKYTDTAGTIRIHAERDATFCSVRIQDSGAGIPADQLPHLFDAFFQGPRSSDRALGGLGLGLALVKSLVHLHGGTVTAQSRGPGYGSVFEVRLPALPLESRTTAETRREEVQPVRTGGRRILLVDDNEDILEIVSTLLRVEGYDVLAAPDGPSALQVAQSFAPDVAVLDIGLPAMDGYDLAQHLREVLGDRTPKLIAMTGYGQAADRERARRAGFAAHLVKPVDASTLIASVRG